jgi:hypothetical protein
MFGKNLRHRIHNSHSSVPHHPVILVPHIQDLFKAYLRIDDSEEPLSSPALGISGHRYSHGRADVCSSYAQRRKKCHSEHRKVLDRGEESG